MKIDISRLRVFLPNKLYSSPPIYSQDPLGIILNSFCHGIEVMKGLSGLPGKKLQPVRYLAALDI